MSHQLQDSREHWARTMEARMDQQRDELRARDPEITAALSGAAWQPVESGEGTLSLAFLGAPLTVDVPAYHVRGGDGRDVSTMVQGLVTTYLHTSSGAPRAGQWIAFRELPDGLFYHQAFAGYTGGRLVRAVGNDLAAFRRGAEAAGGSLLSGLADAAYEFHALPRIWLAVVYWLGDPDEALAPQAQVLFDRAAGQHLVVDGLAILGSQIIHRILAAAGLSSGP